MKKLILSCSVLCVLAISHNVVNAQQNTVTQSKTLSIFDQIDVPSTAVPEQDSKIQKLDKQLRAYEVAYNKQDAAKTLELKTQIKNWKTENQVWIDGLEEHLKQAINRWYNYQTGFLKLNNEG